MLGGQGQEISSACADCIIRKAHTASETEKGLRVEIENLKLELKQGGGGGDNVDKLKVMEEEIAQLEAQNIELKKHLGEMVANHDEDKQLAIEELREENEEQLKEGEKETRELMEGEVRRLKVEVEVLTQTLLEVRSSLTREGDQSAGLVTKIKDMEAQIADNELVKQNLEKRLKEKDDQLQETEKKRVRFERESLTKGEVAPAQLSSLRRQIEAEAEARLLQQASSREDAIRETVRNEVVEEKEEEMKVRLEKERIGFDRILEEQIEQRVEQVKEEP